MKIKKIGNNKKGVELFGPPLIALILGLIVVGLGIYFIFNEYFTQDEINYGVCKESLILRANSPEAPLYIGTASTKDSFPVKCKTEVIDIDFKDTKKAEELIAQTMRGCWGLWSEGKAQFFPGSSSTTDTYCLPCARIHFDEKVRDFYSIEKNKTDVQRALGEKIPKKSITYTEYLGKALAFIKFDGKNLFNVEGSGSDSKIIIPKKLEPSNGDALIFLQQTVLGSGSFDNYIFYFQSGQKSPDPFGLLETTWSNGGILGWVGAGITEATICDNYVGIPA